MTIFSVTLSASRGIKRTLWKPQFPRLIVEIFLGVCYHFWRRITSSFQIWKNFQIWKLLVWKCIFHFRKKYFRTPLAVSRRIEWPLLKTTLPLQDGFCDKSFFSWRSNKTFKIRFGIVNFSPMIDGFYFLWYRHVETHFSFQISETKSKKYEFVFFWNLFSQVFVTHPFHNR